jgi:hypothetical protein
MNSILGKTDNVANTNTFGQNNNPQTSMFGNI